MRHLIGWAAFVATVVASLGVWGCASTSYQRQIVDQRARFDLTCEQISLVELGNATYGASGCGRRATYVVVNCKSGGARSGCQAVMNSNTEASR